VDPETPIACSLDGHDYELRLSAIRWIGRQAVLSAEARPDGATLSFQSSKALNERLNAFVEAESECCPFLTLELKTNQDRLVLNIAAPPEAMPIVREIVRSFTGAKVPT